VGDINQRTQGTEFYGTSSNFVLLNQLFAFARQQDPSRYVGSEGRQSTTHLFPTSNDRHDELPTPSGNGLPSSGEHNVPTGLTALSQDRVSIINLLSNEEVLSPPSRSRTPPNVLGDRIVDDSEDAGRALPTLSHIPEEDSGSTMPKSPLALSRSTRPELAANAITPSNISTNHNEVGTAVSSHQVSKIRLERTFIRVFFNNLQHLHPMLDPILFKERCEREVWSTLFYTERRKVSRHFFALYNIVVAVGALIAGRNTLDDLGPDMQARVAELMDPETPEQRMSCQTISRTYFRKSKDQLGDTSAVCTLESAQTLLLMVGCLDKCAHITC
jgi:hypothetical protein